MTVSTTIPYKRYSCSGTIDYDFDFVIQQETDLTVTYADANGVVALLTLGADYTVTILSTGEGYITTVVVYTTGAIEIRRILPEDQQTRWINNSELDMAILENAMDKLTMLIQQNSVDIAEGNQVSSWRGDWVSGTLYYIGDNVTDPDTGNIYVCKIEHTAGATFAADLALGYWALALDYSNIKNAEANAIAAAEAAAISAAESQLSADSAENSALSAGQSEVSAKADADRAEYFANLSTLNANQIPTGHIMAWLGGYFTNNQNGGYVDVLAGGNDVVAANSYLSPYGYQVCDGTEFQDAASEVFNVPGRFLPLLTDDMFVMGGLPVGVQGGDNQSQGSHVHATQGHVLITAELASHNHSASSATVGHEHIVMQGTEEDAGANFRRTDFNALQSTIQGGAHSHAITVNARGSDAPHDHGDTLPGGSLIDNRPKYLSCFYAIRVKFGTGPGLNYFIVQDE